nr:RNA-directed DNA polymerase, eukaryota [Tanacetum cinerariifolium]
MESDEVIKSSVEDLVPIPSESEGIPDNTCDVPFCDNSPYLDVSKDQFKDFFDSNDDSTLIDDDYFSIDSIDYVEASPPDFELVSLEEVKDNILRAKLLNIHLLIDKIESLNDNPTPDRVLKAFASLAMSLVIIRAFIRGNLKRAMIIAFISAKLKRVIIRAFIRGDSRGGREVLPGGLKGWGTHVSSWELWREKEEGGFDNNGCIFNGMWARIVGSSNFLHLNNIIPNSSFRFQAGCDTHIRFWKDTWVGDSPFYIRFNRLYRSKREKDCLIIDRIGHGQRRWNWSRHNLGAQNSIDLLDMLFEITYAEISEVEYTCIGWLGIDETFFVKDARCIIDSKILPSLAPSTVWDKNIPRKVNIFIWRLSLDRLPHKLNLSSRGIDIQTISCPSCNDNMESSNHIFFECNIAKFIWMLVRKWCDIFFPPFTSYEH